jgi:hypothetical protein
MIKPVSYAICYFIVRFVLTCFLLSLFLSLIQNQLLDPSNPMGLTLSKRLKQISLTRVLYFGLSNPTRAGKGLDLHNISDIFLPFVKYSLQFHRQQLKIQLSSH